MQDERAHALKDWIQNQGNAHIISWSALAGDASLRRYFRLEREGKSYIAVDAPGMREDNHAFVTIAQVLRHQGIRAPEILAQDKQAGFLLIEDFGETLLSDCLTVDSVNAWYAKACDVLLKIQKVQPADFPVQAQLPYYDQIKLRLEMNLFHEWFLARYLGYSLSDDEVRLLEHTYSHLEKLALEQPQCLVHRDYHSRNIMVLASGDLGVIDFQDAVWGPMTYDLVSLLRDCYVKWPKDQVQAWALQYGHQAGVFETTDEKQWLSWFNHMGLQRHIKVMGIFARLFLRDQKPRYLADIPRVFQYIVEVAATEPALENFVTWLKEKIVPEYCIVYPDAAASL